MRTDSDLFWSLLEPIHPAAERFCRQLSGNKEDGDDLYQESLLAALRKFATLRNRDAFRGWLFRIIINRHKNRLRRDWWRGLVGLEEVRNNQALASNPSDRYQAAGVLRQALKSLSAEDRALIVLHEIDGWSISELSRLFRKPEGTIKVRLHRSKRKMHKRIAGSLSRRESKKKGVEGRYAVPGSETAVE